MREGEELGSDAKFYLIDSGTVHCYKTFEVRAETIQGVYLRNIS